MELMCKVERDRLMVRRQFKTTFQQFGHKVMVVWIILVMGNEKQKIDMRHLKVNWTRIGYCKMSEEKAEINDLK